MLKCSSNAAQRRAPPSSIKLRGESPGTEAQFQAFYSHNCVPSLILFSGGSCVNDEKKQKYLCSCEKAWTGEKCETKLGKKRYYLLVKVSVSSTFQSLTMFYVSVSS